MSSTLNDKLYFEMVRRSEDNEEQLDIVYINISLILLISVYKQSNSGVVRIAPESSILSNKILGLILETLESGGVLGKNKQYSTNKNWRSSPLFLSSNTTK